MRSLKRYSDKIQWMFVLSGICAATGALAQASPYAGLWVGSAMLNTVNEVSVPLNAQNVAVASDPQVPTPTFDNAEVRLLVHVNGAGQAFLLKDAAILNRVAGAVSPQNPLGGATAGDVAIVTDARLYAHYPPQPAVRFATASFDFGDARASEALDQLTAQAAEAAKQWVLGYGGSLATSAARNTARNTALPSLVPTLTQSVNSYDITAAFNQFRLDFDIAALDTIADNPNAPIVANFQAAATALRDASGYGDTRAIEMVQAAVAAATDGHATTPVDIAKVRVATRNAAAAYADRDNLYQRFVAGKIFADMVKATVAAAPTAAKASNATTASVTTTLRALPETTAAITEALTTKVQAYDDQRAALAVDTVIDAIVAAALSNKSQAEGTIKALCEQAAHAAQTNLTPRYPTPASAPTLDYDAFVQSAAFTALPMPLATAALNAALVARAEDPLYNEQSLYNAALLAGREALRKLYLEAARARRTELPLTGTFAPGAGDTRLVYELPNPGDLGACGLTGRVILPADYPTNPFRHRRHPDHTTGYKIERVVRLDFDGAAGDALTAAAYGVDRIGGVYREEIFGLHKPLGPNPQSAPIGLKTEGRFELRRVSAIDTLNAR